MKCPNVRVIYDRRKTAEKTGMATVEVQVNFSRVSHKHITMGNATPSTWETIASCSAVKEKVAECERIITSLQKLGEEVTMATFSKYYEAENAKQALKPKNLFNGYDQNQSFINYMKDQVAAESIADGTRAHKLSTIAALEEFGKIRTFADLTPANLWAFDQYLRAQDDKGDYTIWHSYHKKIRMYIHQLKAAGMIPADPYEPISSLIPRGKNKERRPLSEAEIKLILNASLSGMLEKARDLFIFQAYTGLSYGDAMVFDYKKHTEVNNGYVYIDGSRLKTGSCFFTPILPPAMDVLKKYGYRAPKISNQEANVSLHLLEPMLGINKKITTHVARHSFATLALTYGISIETLARMLGHHDIRITQIYAKILKKNVVDQADKMRTGMFGKKSSAKKANNKG